MDSCLSSLPENSRIWLSSFLIWCICHGHCWRAHYVTRTYWYACCPSSLLSEVENYEEINAYFLKIKGGLPEGGGGGGWLIIPYNLCYLGEVMDILKTWVRVLIGRTAEIYPWGIYIYPMPDSNKLRFKYLSHGSLREGPPKVYQDPGLPLIEARDSCFSSKIWAKYPWEMGLHEILGRDYRVEEPH